MLPSRNPGADQPSRLRQQVALLVLLGLAVLVLPLFVGGFRILGLLPIGATGVATGQSPTWTLALGAGLELLFVGAVGYAAFVVYRTYS